MKHALVLLLVACVSASVLGAASKDKEKSDAEKKEEALRKEALDLYNGSIGKEGQGIVSVEGRFTLAKELAADQKPFPKLVGYLSSKGTAYPVLAPAKDVLALLTGFDNKDTTVSGKILNKGDQGIFLVVSEVIFPPAAPQLKRKRGGLP